MKQSFIKIGEGLTDLFEFTTLIEYNHTRINRIVYFHTPHSEKPDLELYFNYLISVLRLQRWIPPLQ
ncbi:MAG: hypothetical protein E6837_02735 [Staphylococcus epidermidis]|nr:hypothetical protein [Staphylococcus epidermidis]